MGADVGETGLDLGDAMRIGRRLGFGQERVALRIGLEHDLDQAFGTIRRFLREPPDTGARRQRELAVIERHVACNGTKQRGLAGPLRPTRPTRAPSGMRAEAPSSNSLPATRSVTSSITSIRAIWPTKRRDAMALELVGWLSSCETHHMLRFAADGVRKSSTHLQATGCDWRRIIMCVPGCQEALRADLS